MNWSAAELLRRVGLGDRVPDEQIDSVLMERSTAEPSQLGVKASIGSAAIALLLAWAAVREPSPSWRFEYFPNTRLEGTSEPIERSVVDFTDLQRSRFPAGVPDREAFSMRGRTCLKIAASGSYYLRARGDDGVRLFLDNKLEIDSWARPAAGGGEKQLTLTEGQHALTVEYVNLGGPGSLQVEMSDPAFRGVRPLHDRTVAIGSDGKCDQH